MATIYINLEDDVSKVVTRLKREKATEVTLVCPKRSLIFSDSINLKLLKKQADILKKNISILTMDEKGQLYAKQAGFTLKSLPKAGGSTKGMSDVRAARPAQAKEPVKKEAYKENALTQTAKSVAKLIGIPKDFLQSSEPEEVVEEQSFQQPHTPKVLVKDVAFPKEIEETTKLNKKKAHNKRVTVIFAATSVLLILAVVFAVLPKATVAIYPKTEAVIRDIEVSMSTNASSPDSSRLVMPAKRVEESMEVQNRFQSQGKKEVGNKASGTIRIYNFTRSPLNLKAGTTTLNVGTKTYVLASDVNSLKPTTYKNATTKEIDESSLGAPVEIIASQGGESYNLPAGARIEITNQVFGSNPQFLYAKSETAITGGTSRFLSVVSQQDITSSQQTLTDLLLNTVKDKLAQQGLSIQDKAYAGEVLGFTTDTPAGTESPNFDAALKAKITGLAFSEDSLEKLIRDRIAQTISTDKVILENGDNKLVYKLKNMDINNGLAVFLIHYEGRARIKYGLEDIRSQLTGKSQEEVDAIIKSKVEVDKIEITLAPSWQNSLPWFKGMIKLEVVE
jgi:hypothetical protein